MTDDTRMQTPDPSSSELLSMARIAMARSTRPDGLWSWPALDFNDPAQRQFGDYELLSEIGRGGMGVVYRARQHSLDREVALKFIAAGLSDTHHVTRFIGEARTAARLVHPNIVPVFEVGSIDGIHYFSMPLIEGESLAQRLQREALPTHQLLRLLLQVAEAVDYAHRLGLLHLDLKPANILIDARGEPLIADFGLARRMDENGAVRAQEVSGTPSFMAPEQILIKQYQLTAATDLYALGAILYRCLAGVSPHGSGNSDDLIRRALAGRIQPLHELNPKVPADLEAICGKCLALDPRDRYPRVRELIEDLRRVESGLPVSVRRPGYLERAQRWLKREPKLAAAVVAAFVAIASGGLLALAQWQQAEAARAAESQQRQRAEDAAALGARLYAQTPGVDDQDDDPGAEVVRWLQARVPDDTRRQAQILADFARAIADDSSPLHVGSLFYPVLDVLGQDYRARVIEKLRADGSPDALIRAAMLAWRDERRSAQDGTTAALIERALTLEPDHAFGWYIASTFCHRTEQSKCPAVDAARNWTRADPDNAYAWAMLAGAQGHPEGHAALHEAAQRPEFRDYSSESYEAYLQAVEGSGVPPPPHLAEILRVLAPGEETSTAMAAALSGTYGGIPPLHGFAAIRRLCNPDKLANAPGQVRANCFALGMRMVRHPGSVFTTMAGNVIVRELVPDSPLDASMWTLQARYVFLREMHDQLTAEQLAGYPFRRILADMREVGELESYARIVEHYGLPTTPPPGWKPKNSRIVLSRQERRDRQATAPPAHQP